MKKSILITMMLTFANFAFATSLHPNTGALPPAGTDTLYCSFTEPFFSVTYEAKTGLISYTGVEDYDPVTDTFPSVTLSSNGYLKPIFSADADDDFYSIQGSQFELVDGDTNTVLMTLTLDMQGQDGMSDQIYPFSAVYKSYIGGCYTDKYPAVNTVDIYMGLTRQ